MGVALNPHQETGMKSKGLLRLEMCASSMGLTSLEEAFLCILILKNFSFILWQASGIRRKNLGWQPLYINLLVSSLVS